MLAGDADTCFASTANLFEPRRQYILVNTQRHIQAWRGNFERWIPLSQSKAIEFGHMDG